MRLLLVFLSSLLLVSSQICYDVYPADCAMKKNIICSNPSYAVLVSQICRLTCGICSNGGSSGSPGSGSSGSSGGSGSILDPNPGNTNYRTQYLNTNAAV